MRCLSATLVVTLLVTPIGCERYEPAPEVSVGDPIPAFSVKGSDGNTYTEHSFNEGVSVICFFNTSCPDCREELPVLQEIHGRYPLTDMLLISRSEGEQPIRQYWNETGLSLTYSAQSDAKVFSLFARNTIPHLFLSRDGIVRFIHTDSPVPDLNTLESEILSLL